MYMKTLALVAWLFLFEMQPGPAATLVFMVDEYGQPPILSINAGDTVVWSNQNNRLPPIQSYDGKWQSPSNEYSSFAFTFTNAGFSAYKFGAFEAGTITVLPWTNSPPAISINFPTDGFNFNGIYCFPILASLADGVSNIVRVDYYGDEYFLGSASSAPYRVDVVSQLQTGFNGGMRSLVAKAFDDQGSEIDSAPVKIFIDSLWNQNGNLSYPRL